MYWTINHRTGCGPPIKLKKLYTSLQIVTWNRLIETHPTKIAGTVGRLTDLSRIYIVWPTYREFLNSEKKSRKFLADLSQNRLIERPTYRISLCISLLRQIIQVCSIFTNSNSSSVANCFAFRFTIWYVSVMLSRTAFQPKDPSPLNIRIFTLTTTFDLPANDVSSTLSHCSFFANISLTVDSPQWKSLARSLLVREGLSSLFWHGLFFALQSMLL